MKGSISTEVTGDVTQAKSINILVALSCEAKPIIDFYRLKKVSIRGFAHFYREANSDHLFDINLVVSGIGSANMLQACGWLAAKTEAASCAWLNVGTAGHMNLDLGQVFQVVHCAQNDSDKAHYPPLVVNTTKKRLGQEFAAGSVSLLSNNAPVSDYPANHAVDMEGYSFFLSAKRFASSELVHSLKVISDNKKHGLELLNASRISELIAPSVKTIDAFIVALISIVPQAEKQFTLAPMLRDLHCTVSQKSQYQDLMNKLDNINLERSVIDAALKGTSSMSEVLKKLRELQLTVEPKLNAQTYKD